MFQLLRGLTRTQKACILLAMDLALIPLALLFTLTVQSLPTRTLVSFAQVAPGLPTLAVVAAVTSLWLGLPYVRLNAYERHATGLTALLALVVAITSAGASAVLGADLPLGIHVVFGIIYFVFLVAARLALYQVVTAIYNRAQPICRVLIYGAGTTGTQLAQVLRTHETIDPVAFIDDNRSLQGKRVIGLPVFAPTRIPAITEKRAIRRVLLAMPSQTPQKQAQITTRLQKMGLEVQALPSFAQLIGEEPLVDKLIPVAPQDFLGRETCDVRLDVAEYSYADRVVLVSGAGGSIGSELCRQLLACRPAKLVLFELSELALYTVHQELMQHVEGLRIEVVPVLGSVTDARQVRKALTDHGVEVVVHAAAYKHVPLVEANPLAGLSNNVFGTRTLAGEAADVGVERFILISSDKAVRPANVMGASKRLAELVLQDLASRHTGTVFAMVRFGNVLGSSGSVVPLFQEQIRRGGPVTVTDPGMKRYFMTIHEAVRLVLKAGSAACGSEVFVLDMGKPVPILQLARQIIHSAGYSVRDEDNPGGDIEIRIVGLRPGEKMEEELTLSPNLTATRHPKIFCAQEEHLSEIEVAVVLRGLRQALAANSEEAARAVIQRWVEGYGTLQAGSAGG